MNEKDRVYLSPIGGGVAAICFFLPWAGCQGKNFSGADAGGSLWLVFLAAVAIVAAFFYFKDQKQIAKAKPIVLVCSLAGIALMLINYVRLQDSEVGRFLEIKFGSVGSLLGFVCALFGTQYLDSDQPKHEPTSTPGSTPESGSRG